eukprot:1216274-Amphidinium_carterae.1
MVDHTPLHPVDHAPPVDHSPQTFGRSYVTVGRSPVTNGRSLTTPSPCCTYAVCLLVARDLYRA